MEAGIRQLTQEERLRKWAEIINTCRSSELTTRAWCAENGIGIKSYYYWQKKIWERVRESERGSAALVELPAAARQENAVQEKPAKTSNYVLATVQTKSFQVELYEGISSELAKLVLTVVSQNAE